MVEKVVTLGIERDLSFLYFIRNGDVWRVKRKREGDNILPELVAEANATVSPKHILFLDADGDVACVQRPPKTTKPRRKRTPKAS